jgi:hypothetical protein
MNGPARQPSVFSRLMLQWERLAPYNAGQYMTLQSAVSIEEATRAFPQTVSRLGLSQLNVPGDALVHRVDEPLPAFISRSLNTAFAKLEGPLRPFACEDETGFHLGVIYHHAVADSVSIRLVLRDWLGELADRSLCSDRAIRLDAGVKVGWLDFLRETPREIARLWRVKSVRRIPVVCDARSPVAYRRFELEAGLADRLLARSREKQVKVNDVFTAAAAMACIRHLLTENSFKRPDLAIGTIVDVRDAGVSALEHFGVRLGFLQTIFPKSDTQRIEDLLTTAATQSRVHKDKSAAAKSVIRLAAAERFGRWLSDDRLLDFYRKRSPLAAGVSNVNLNTDWPGKVFPRLLKAYTRISPLGPIAPIVFTPTTLGDSLHIGFTYRTSVASEARAELLAAAFIEAVTGFASARR